MANRTEREFEVIVFGAASFVGKILCRYLLQRHGAEGDLRWAIAGRNQGKLDAVNVEHGLSIPTIVADAGNSEDMKTMAARTQVVCTTVGPYALYGSELVAACAAGRTDYCDLTGEPQWMRRMIDQHEAAAAESGARIVHNCGFDSIPSDLGVWFTQQQAVEKFGAPCSQVRLGVKAMKGGFSGGTVASMINALRESAADPSVRREMQNPYAICPAAHRSGVRQPNVTTPQYDPNIDQWLAPFVMASINTRVVHRSHALAGFPWGQDFLYDEAMLMGSGIGGRLKATSTAVGLGGFIGMLALKPTRALLLRTFLPKPGEGPTPAEQEAGFFDLRFYGETADGQTIGTKVTGDRDPGYGSTAKMLGEAAVCLARDIGEEVPGGFPTPSRAMAAPLIERLQEHAGLKFEVLG